MSPIMSRVNAPRRAKKIQRPLMGLPTKEFGADVSVLDLSEARSRLLESGVCDKLIAVKDMPSKDAKEVGQMIDDIEASREFMDFQEDVRNIFKTRYPDATLVTEHGVVRFCSNDLSRAVREPHTDQGVPRASLHCLLETGVPKSNPRSKPINHRELLGKEIFDKLKRLVHHPNSLSIAPISVWICLKSNSEATLRFVAPKDEYIKKDNPSVVYHRHLTDHAQLWALENNEEGLGVAFKTSRLPHFAVVAEEGDFRLSTEVRFHAVWEQSAHPVWP